MSRITTVVFLLSLSAAIWAQSGNSILSGTVKDATNAAVPGANVKIVNLDSGVQLETVTNESGLYRVGALVPGRYQVEVEASGLTTSLEVRLRCRSVRQSRSI